MCCSFDLTGKEISIKPADCDTAASALIRVGGAGADAVTVHTVLEWANDAMAFFYAMKETGSNSALA